MKNTLHILSFTWALLVLALPMNAQNQKIPYMLVIGDREVEAESVSVRLRSEENLGAMSIGEFQKRAEKDIAGRE